MKVAQKMLYNAESAGMCSYLCTHWRCSQVYLLASFSPLCVLDSSASGTDSPLLCQLWDWKMGQAAGSSGILRLPEQDLQEDWTVGMSDGAEHVVVLLIVLHNYLKQTYRSNWLGRNRILVYSKTVLFAVEFNSFSILVSYLWWCGIYPQLSFCSMDFSISHLFNPLRHLKTNKQKNRTTIVCWPISSYSKFPA